MSISILFAVNTLPLRIVLFLIAIGVTIHLVSLKTLPKNFKEEGKHKASEETERPPPRVENL